MTQIALEIAPALLASREHHVSMRDAVLIGASAVLLRFAIFLAISIIHNLSVEQYAMLYDGRSYLVTAGDILKLNTDISLYHARVFPGFPGLVALLSLTGVPLVVGALGVNWISSGIAAGASSLLFRDRRIGWAMVVLIPHYLMNSSMAMTEAPMLALATCGVLLACRERIILAGVLLGLAGLVRPIACFPTMGIMVLLLIRKQGLKSLVLGLTAMFVVIAGLALVFLWRGDALAGIRFYASSPAAYGGDLFTWPFTSLIRTPLQEGISLGRTAYIWAHAAVVIAACAMLLWRVRSGDARDQLCIPWLLGNTLLTLCIGNIWGFECFHRFIIPAQPAMFWAMRRVLPRHAWLWLLIGCGSGAIAIGSAG